MDDIKLVNDQPQKYGSVNFLLTVFFDNSMGIKYFHFLRIICEKMRTFKFYLEYILRPEPEIRHFGKGSVDFPLRTLANLQNHRSIFETNRTNRPNLLEILFLR